MTADWLDDLLDRHPGEPVPQGFRSRLRRRLEQEGLQESAAAAAGRQAAVTPSHPRSFGRWIPVAVAAGLLLFLGGFWAGRGAPSLSSSGPSPDPELASLELVELYRNQELLEAWPLVADGELELGLFDAAAGTWELDQPEEQ